MEKLAFVKPAIFHPTAIAAVRQFPEIVRKELGKAMFDTEGIGRESGHARCVAALNTRGVAELRIRDRSGIYRAFCYTQSPRGILVFHAFAKKNQATPIHELELARKRLKELLHEQI
jgi:phage-related protein